MTSDIKAHMMDYAALGFWLMAGLLALMYFRSNSTRQFGIVVLMVSGYVFWGIYHHARLKNLSSKIVLEYGLIACISLVLVWAVMSMM